MKRTAAILAITGALLLGYWLTIHIQERLFQSEARSRSLIGRYEKPVAGSENTSQSNPYTQKAIQHPEPGAVIAMMDIPRIGLSVAVVEGVDDEQLRLAAGHIPGTSFPGENSNVAFAAHRDTHFRPLRSVRLDDEIAVTAGARLFRYRVVSIKIVKPEDIQVLYPADGETLTLVTCYPFHYIGAAPSRFIVRAACTNCGQISAAAPEPGGK
jgi:sortase A